MSLTITPVPEDLVALLDGALPANISIYEVNGQFIFPVYGPKGLAPAAFVYLVKRGHGEPTIQEEMGHTPGEIVLHGSGWFTCGVEFKLSDSFAQKKEKLREAIRALGGKCQ